MNHIYIGHDSRERDAYQACAASLLAHARAPLSITPISSRTLGALYKRPESRRGAQLFDEISQAPMATEFALARFFVPFLHETGWAVFCDGDFLFRAPVDDLLAMRHNEYAVMVVKHDHSPGEQFKMDGQAQTVYPRKNWSSLMLFNCDHPANRSLDLARLNTSRGLGLHQFDWLPDSAIGSLPFEWNWLEGSYSHIVLPGGPKAVHFTRGIPSMPGYENVPYADEWRTYASRHAAP